MSRHATRTASRVGRRAARGARHVPPGAGRAARGAVRHVALGTFRPARGAGRGGAARGALAVGRGARNARVGYAGGLASAHDLRRAARGASRAARRDGALVCSLSLSLALSVCPSSLLPRPFLSLSISRSVPGSHESSLLLCPTLSLCLSLCLSSLSLAVPLPVNEMKAYEEL